MSFLSQVKEGKIEDPICLILYGVDGIGKSTFGAEAPKPIFLGAERGTSQMDVARLPEPKNFSECKAMVSELLTSEAKYETLVIDTLDWLEPMIQEEVCAEHKTKPKRLSDIGYNKGYELALSKTRDFATLLSELRMKKNMNIILLAHSKIKTFNDPSVANGYDRHQLAMRDDTAGLWRQFVDAVLFVNYEVFVREEGDRRGQGTGSRVMHTEERPAYQAKNRYGLPETLPFVKGKLWSTFFNAVQAASKPKTADELKAEIGELRLKLKDEQNSKLGAWLEKTGNDVAGLITILDRVKEILGGAA